jgi:hypothetical protein
VKFPESSRKTRSKRSRNNFKSRLQLQNENSHLLKKAQQELQEIKAKLNEQEEREKLIQERAVEKKRQQEEYQNNVREMFNDEEILSAHVMNSLEIVIIKKPNYDYNRFVV